MRHRPDPGAVISSPTARGAVGEAIREYGSSGGGRGLPGPWVEALRERGGTAEVPNLEVVMPSPEEILREHPFFAGMPDEYYELLSSVARPVHIEANQFLFRQGGAADCFLVLHRGDMALELHVGGRGARIIQTVNAGEVVGWSWMHTPHRWMYDGRALNTVECLCLDGEAVRTLMAEDHELGYQILQRFSEVIVEALNATRLQLLDVYGDGG